MKGIQLYHAALPRDTTRTRANKIEITLTMIANFICMSSPLALPVTPHRPQFVAARKICVNAWPIRSVLTGPSMVMGKFIPGMVNLGKFILGNAILGKTVLGKIRCREMSLCVKVSLSMRTSLLLGVSLSLRVSELLGVIPSLELYIVSCSSL